MTFHSFWVLLFSLLLASCIPAANTMSSHEESEVVVSGKDNTPARFASYPQANTDLERLAELWKARNQNGLVTDFPIGPGDVLEISVPAMKELQSRTVRVSGEGRIFLPFIGHVDAKGLTEEELAEECRSRLEKYMHNPRVFIFVKEYRSRQVAVLGAVGKPGIYSLNTEADTILDLISRAGGIKPGADPRIHLIPADLLEKGEALKVVSTMPSAILSQDPSPLILKRTDPIWIDLKDLAYGGYQDYLSLPVRPGDIIMVPGGAHVLVEGWVGKPGAYDVSPGLTVSGVVAAAGGSLFAADTSAVKVIRTERGGKKTFYKTDLEKIKNGEMQDITLQGGDIVEVASAPGKLVPYSMYRFFSTIVSIGVSGSIPLF
jgi:polysaccharide export outer membrane protein